MGVMGCAHPGTRVQREELVDFAKFRAIGVPSFKDPKGQGERIAQSINDALQKRMYDPVDGKALEKILAQYKLDKDSGFGLEAMETIRRQTSADAVVLGRMAPDWSEAYLVMFETDSGDPVLRAVLKPRGKKKTVFASPDEVAEETLRVLTGEVQ